MIQHHRGGDGCGAGRRRRDTEAIATKDWVYRVDDRWGPGGCKTHGDGGGNERRHRKINTQQEVHCLVLAERSSPWSVYNETMLLTYDDGYRSTTPRDPVEAAEVKRMRYPMDARARARADETASDTDGSTVKMVTPNWYARTRRRSRGTIR